ncbi:MAG: YcaO-like family protein [Candidatus Aminicenantes bacterium]|nr:YcaO-like family protein [Candidatus Aminicenantes bacterium]
MDKYRFYTDEEKSQLLLRYQLNHFLKQTISRRCGIIKSVFEHYCEPDIARVYNFSTILCKGTRFGDGYYDAPQNNGAAGFNRMRSFVGAIGESLERYCSTYQDPKDFIFGSYNQMIKNYNAFDPEKIALFSERQYAQTDFPFTKFTRDTKVRWVECERLNPDGTSTPIYYPCWMVYMPYARQPEEPVMGYSISTGMAAGPHGEARSTLSGLLETLERDAYIIAWHNRMPAPKLDWRSSPKISRMVHDLFPDADYLDLNLSLVTTDIQLPVMIASKIEKNSPNACLAMGVSAHPDLEKCAEDAIKEMVQDYYYIRYLVRAKEKVEITENFLDIDDFEKRVVLWGYPAMLPHYDFLVKDPKETLTFDQARERFPHFARTFQSDEERVLHVVKLCSDLGYDVIHKDITSPDTYSLGVQVCKTFVPQAQPMEGDQNFRYFGGTRLYDVPVKLGYRDTRPNEDEFNPIPHPLP